MVRSKSCISDDDDVHRRPIDCPCVCWRCVLDNVFAIKTWVKNKLAVEEALIDKQFDIPETFDYIE